MEHIIGRPSASGYGTVAATDNDIEGKGLDGSIALLSLSSYSQEVASSCAGGGAGCKDKHGYENGTFLVDATSMRAIWVSPVIATADKALAVVPEKIVGTKSKELLMV